MSDKRIIIFGVTKYAGLISQLCLEVDGQMVACHTVDREYIKYEDIENPDMPVVPFEEIENYYPSDKYKILPVVGYKNMNDNRKAVFEKILSKGYEIASFIHPTAYIAKNAQIGVGNIFSTNVTILPFAKIGNGNIFSPRTAIAHHTIVGDYNFFALASSILGNVHITHNCFLGCNCIVKNSITIMPYTLVGAGAYVSTNTQKYSVIVPPKSICLDNRRSIDIDLK
jgi:sugar O-acyltransferase (sialic acid O-acetyltransferase NeuD family)